MWDSGPRILILEKVIRGSYDVEPEVSSQTFANIQLKPEVIVRIQQATVGCSR